MIALAETLGVLLDYCGGPGSALYLLKPLEKLCQIEEAAVREKVSDPL